MEKKRIIELIKLETIGCISGEDRESLRSIRENEDDFPWKELADYQNMVSLLASTLELKYPGSELKDKTAMKLYNIRDEIETKLEAKKAKEVSSAPIQEEKIEIEEKVLAEVEAGIEMGGDEFSQIKEIQVQDYAEIPAEIESKVVSYEPEEEENKNLKITPDKEFIEKVAADYINSYYENELGIIRKSIKRNMYLSIVFFLITLGLIAALYFI